MFQKKKKDLAAATIAAAAMTIRIAILAQNLTAVVTFANESQRSTYRVIWDGSDIGAIRPGQTLERTVNAGRHTNQFVFANTNRGACGQSRPDVVACRNIELSCRNDL